MLFERLRLNWKIRRLQRLKDQNVCMTIKAIHEVAHETGEIPNKDAAKKEILNTDELNRQIGDHIAILETNYWLEKAQRCLLPTPNDEAYILQRNTLTEVFSQMLQSPEAL